MRSAVLQRVELLFRQSRFSEARELLQQHLADYPDDAQAQFYMASTFLQLGEKKKARQLSEMLLSKEPDAFHILALAVEVEMADENYERAENVADELVAKYPQYAESYVKLAAVKLAQRNYDRAMDAARLALEIDPENVDALNLKILVGGLLGDPSTKQSIEEALHLDPESASTIANQGMQLLREGKVKESLERIKYALSLDPTNEMARYAMMQSLKARFWPYRMFLKFAEFSARLSGQASWAVIIGAYVLYQVINNLANKYEALAPYLTPLVWLIGGLFLLTWILDPLMNLYLLSNPYGRLLLDEDSKKMAQFCGLSFGMGLLGFALHFALQTPPFLLLGILGILLMIPLGTFLKPSGKKNRQLMTYFTIGIVASGLLGILFGIGLLQWAALIGLFAYQWVINGILIKENSRVF
ncbi:MAG: tetratricopeptide repeat protein [Bacteroidota bacterium]